MGRVIDIAFILSENPENNFEFPYHKSNVSGIGFSHSKKMTCWGGS